MSTRKIIFSCPCECLVVVYLTGILSHLINYKSSYLGKDVEFIRRYTITANTFNAACLEKSHSRIDPSGCIYGHRVQGTAVSVDSFFQCLQQIENVSVVVEAVISQLPDWEVIFPVYTITHKCTISEDISISLKM